MAPDSSKTEGLCHMCGEFKPYQNHKGSGKGPTPWFRRESRYLSIFSHCPVRLSSISTPSRCSRVPSILLSQKRGEEEHETCSKPQLIKKHQFQFFANSSRKPTINDSQSFSIAPFTLFSSIIPRFFRSNTRNFFAPLRERFLHNLSTTLS